MESQALLVLLLFVLVLSIFLGFELINKVPSTHHTDTERIKIKSANANGKYIGKG